MLMAGNTLAVLPPIRLLPNAVEQHIQSLARQHGLPADCIQTSLSVTQSVLFQNGHWLKTVVLHYENAEKRHYQISVKIRLDEQFHLIGFDSLHYDWPAASPFKAT